MRTTHRNWSPQLAAAIPESPRRLRRGLAAAAAAFALVAGSLIVLTSTANAAGTLLSQGKPTTASSAENATYPAANATDGNTTTRWSSAFSDPQWLQVDLGAAATISQVTLTWEPAYATAFQIQTSNDASSWTTIYSTTTGTGGTQTLTVNGTGRYVRMYGTARVTPYGYSLWEFQVYGSFVTGSGCGTANAAQGRPTTASSTENATYPAANATDGNTTTRWSSTFGDPQWLQVDLGSTQSICGVTLTWEPAYAKAFQIQTSNDATTWTTIYNTTTGTGGTQNLSVSGSGRYVRMYGTARATAYGYSLWEFAVFLGSGGTTTPPPTGNPVTMTNGFYVDPSGSALTWANANPGDGRAASIKSAIGNTPMARWFGNWSGDIGAATGSYVGAAAAAGKLPVLVAYNIPNRDICAGQSAGGAGTDAAYNTWIAAFAGGIGTRPALVILEPDSLGDESCMSQAQIDDRNGLLNNAITQFTNQAPNTWVYIDAGNPGWLDATTMAQHLNAAGLARAHGFALNVSNFYTTAQDITYGNSVNATLSGYGYTRPFVVDTSRNGNGSNGEWCNPAGRKIGTPPQLGGGAEMLLWLKTVGESDGDCGVGAGSTAGQFLPQVAYNLVFGY